MARRSLHYAWVVAIVTFVILLVTAGIRATPGVLMLSLEREFGWSRAVISSAVASTSRSSGSSDRSPHR